MYVDHTRTYSGRVGNGNKVRHLRLHPDPHRDPMERSAVLHLGRPVGRVILTFLRPGVRQHFGDA